MKRRIRKLRRCLVVAALIGGAVWAWYGVDRARETGTPGGHTAASPAPQHEVRLRPIDPIQLHLIPRTQPTPMSPSFRPPRPPE